MHMYTLSGWKVENKNTDLIPEFFDLSDYHLGGGKLIGKKLIHVFFVVQRTHLKLDVHDEGCTIT
jgi:hypothetical protein